MDPVVFLLSTGWHNTYFISVSADASTTGGLAAGASGGMNDATTVHGGYRRGLAVFTIAKGGLMFEAVLGGQKFSYTPLGPQTAQ